MIATSGFDACDDDAIEVRLEPEFKAVDGSASGLAGKWPDALSPPLRNQPHTVIASLQFPTDVECQSIAGRQWILNIGQGGTGAHHWLWAPAGIQFGVWCGAQISKPTLQDARYTVCTVWDGTHYLLYKDGVEVARTRALSGLDIRTGEVSIATGYDGDFTGCVRSVQIFRSALSAAQVLYLSEQTGVFERNGPWLQAWQRLLLAATFHAHFGSHGGVVSIDILDAVATRLASRAFVKSDVSTTKRCMGEGMPAWEVGPREGWCLGSSQCDDTIVTQSNAWP